MRLDQSLKNFSTCKIDFAKLYLLLIMVFSLAMISTATVGASEKKNVSPTPDGYEKYIIFMGNGIWRSVDGSIMVDGLIDGDGLSFQKEIMGRTDEEIEEERNNAIQFFSDRFGVDVINNNAVLFTGFEVDSRNNMRAYTVSGEDVPARGWEVRDGGWGVFVVDPNGIDLGGEFEGVNIPVMSALLFGDYNIKTGEGKNAREIVIHYESDLPFSFDQFGAGMIRCVLISEDYGNGLAGGLLNPLFLDENFLVQQDIRNILTFSK